jgi:Domain of unknown function (DUF1854)
MNDHSSNIRRNGVPPAQCDEGFELLRDEWKQLSLVGRSGRCFHNVRVVPLFPITDPDHWISICSSDGWEIACVSDSSTLDPNTRLVLQEELSHREFLPIIQRIVHITGNNEPCEWAVETDRGPTRFVLESEDHVRRLGPNTVTVMDASGIRYLIDDIRKLDRRSRRVVEWYV